MEIGDNSIMGLQKIAFNFIVERGGKLAKSFLLCSKPVSKPINFKGLKYISNLSNDVLKLSEEQKLYNVAKKILGRDLNISTIDNAVDIEHSLPGAYWNGTVNCINEAIRYNMYIDKQVINKIDNLMQSAKKTPVDVIAYRGESYEKGSKHLAKILNLKAGDKFTDNTYRYITANKEYAEHFSGYFPIKVKYNYILPKGSICIGTCEKECALLPRETFSEILSIDKSNPYNIVINAILRTS